MIVYTFQHANSLEGNKKQMICSSEYWDEDMKEYYEWMYQQYEERIGSAIKSLIWVWGIIPESYFDYEEEDDNGYWETERGQYDRFRILVTVDILEDRILWSDFDAWHCPLNNGAILSELEVHEEERGKVFPKRYGWERVFDFEWLEANGWGGDIIKQGVIDKIRLEDIKEVRLYDAKYKKFID